MSKNFSISPLSVQGLGLGLKDGSYSIEKDLALVKNGREWKLINLTKESLPQGNVIVRGQELAVLMHAVANGEKGLPAGFPSIIDGRDFQILASDSKFQGLSRLIPGMESPEHIQSRTKSGQVTKRLFESAKVIGKGSAAIENQGLTSRYVGEGQGNQNYWIREVVFRDALKPMREVDILISAWDQDQTSTLSLKDWTKSKQDEWQKVNAGKPFLAWLAAETFDKKERGAWEKAHPGQPFDANAFAAWKQSEADPELILPTWLLKELSGKNNNADFQAWRTEVINDRKEGFENFKKEAGIINLTFEEHEILSFEYDNSGAIENAERWILARLWEQAKSDPINPTKDDFPTYVQRLKFVQEFPAAKTESEFRNWLDTQEQKSHIRHQGSNLPLAFEAWKLQQEDGLLVDPAPFILLDPEERKKYRTTCDQGMLIRNGFAYNTEFDKTRHSGAGYGIFVVGPDQDLYCGSHIGGVFHHSSFLGEGAIAAAGEVKTDSNGNILELSSKSGHYQPTDSQNLYMLRYFRDHGADLGSVKFTFYGEKGKTEERNALDHLNQLEYIESMGGLDKIDPSAF
jgi:hypothetical protein